MRDKSVREKEREEGKIGVKKSRRYREIRRGDRE